MSSVGNVWRLSTISWLGVGRDIAWIFCITAPLPWKDSVPRTFLGVLVSKSFLFPGQIRWIVCLAWEREATLGVNFSLSSKY
jgi:hypothetical protein